MPLATLGALVLAVSPQAAAIRPPDVAPFPFAPVDVPDTAGVELLPLTDLFDGLAARERVALTGVPLPGGGEVDLALRRARVADESSLLWVDGQPRGPLAEADVSLWSGAVRGEPRSEAFLALSPHGSRGWIAVGGATYHLLAGPDAAGTWTAPTARLVADADVRAEGHAPSNRCLAQEIRQPATPALPLQAVPGAETGLSPILEAFVAVETDSQYHDVFGDTPATVAYTLALMGAVSERYREDIGVVLTLSHVALYTDETSDPWTSGDVGGSCLDQLFEYQDKTLAGEVQARGNVFTFLSGSNFGCGVAYLPGLCDPVYRFSVTGNLDGLLDFPVEQGPLNWDFIVVAHELGHNFGAPHTHDWCPQPLDECAPDWAGFGDCQDEQICLDDGYLMSYCHLCDGGYENIDLRFHRVSRQAMRALAEGTCLEPY